MAELRIEAHESMFVLDGGPDAALPDGSGGPILAGPEALFVAGRVAADAPTVLRVGQPGGQEALVLAYEGLLATPDRRLRVVTVLGDVLGEVAVPNDETPVQVFLSDLEEPDLIFVAVAPSP